MTIQDLADTPSTAKNRLEVTPGQFHLVKSEENRVNRIRREKRKGVAFVSIYKRRENIQPIAFLRIRLRPPKLIDLF